MVYSKLSTKSGDIAHFAASRGRHAVKSSTFLSDHVLGPATEQKKQLRLNVLKFWAPYFPDRGPVKICTLPGAHWDFEQDIKNAFCEPYRRETQFIGFEQNLAIMHRGLSRVPRLPKVPRAPRADCIWRSWGKTDYAKTNLARWINADVNDFILCERDEIPVPLKFKFWDMVWLDYTGCMHPKMESALSVLHRFLNRESRRIPVVITFLASRESHKATKAALSSFPTRSQYMHFLLDRMPNYSFHLEGESDLGGHGMKTIFGVYNRVKLDSQTRLNWKWS